jgi:hypothetical protein
LFLTLVAVPATAQQLCSQEIMYENGPVNGQVYARMINFGYAVTNSFQAIDGVEFLSGFSFWAWLYPGDDLSSVEVSIGSTPYGTDVFQGVVNTSQENCFINNFGYNVCLESVSSLFLHPSGTYWWTLQNASVPSDNPVYWDQNSGVGCMSPGCPSKALQKAAGVVPPTASIPSEAFAICGVGFASPSNATTH